MESMTQNRIILEGDKMANSIQEDGSSLRQFVMKQSKAAIILHLVLL